jgi:hypothetical protein
MSKIIVKDLAGPSSSSNKIYIASGSELDIANSTGTINLAVDAADIASGTLANARLPDGTVIQTVQSAYTTDFSQTVNGTSYAFINTGTEDLAVTITPTSTDSKVLLSFNFGRISGHSTGTGWGLGCIIVRGTTSVGISTSTAVPKASFNAGVVFPNYNNATTFQFLDSPSTTSATTYKIKVIGHSNSDYTMLVNKPENNSTNTYEGWACQTITTFIAQEIKG